MLDYSNLSHVLPIKPLRDYSSVTNKKTENTTPEKKNNWFLTSLEDLMTLYAQD